MRLNNRLSFLYNMKVIYANIIPRTNSRLKLLRQDLQLASGPAVPQNSSTPFALTQTNVSTYAYCKHIKGKRLLRLIVLFINQFIVIQ